ncbi:MAG: hypothetical protein EOP84_06150 [Verrucomicrobiaceae bacterium]|nr:MAG: hypothetical protein EOP84_06150 [Verrucomicrobiaceae bacterium]
MRFSNSLLTIGLSLGLLTASAHAGTRVKIDISEQRAYLYEDGKLVTTSSVSSGRKGYRTPMGSYRVQGKERLHRSTLYGSYVGSGGTVRRDVDVRRHRRPAGARFRGAPMPYFIRFNGGVGMHGGNVPDHPASHGCVRLPHGKAQFFYNRVSVGTPVSVVP